MAKERWRVHSFDVVQQDVPAKDEDGDLITGVVPCALIELVPIHGHGKSHTVAKVVKTAKQLAELRDLFEIGAIIEDRGWAKIMSAADAAKAEADAVAAAAA